MKQRNLTCSILLTGLLLLFFSCKEPVSELSLAGEWRFAFDPQDVFDELAKREIYIHEEINELDD